MRTEYRQRAVGAALRAGELTLLDGDADTAVRLAGRAVGMDQFSEAGWRLMMVAYLALGRRTAALRAFRSCARLLREELGIELSPRTMAVLAEILADDVRRDAAPGLLRPRDGAWMKRRSAGRRTLSRG